MITKSTYGLQKLRKLATGTIWIPNHHALIASFIKCKEQVQKEKYPLVEHVTLYNYLEISLREI